MPGFQNTPPKKHETSMEHPPFRWINVFLTYLLAGWLLLHHPQHFTTAQEPLERTTSPKLRASSSTSFHLGKISDFITAWKG